MYVMFYTDKVEKLWYFDENGNMSHTLGSRKRVKQGCVLGAFGFSVTMTPVYNILQLKLRLNGLLVAFSDDVYLHGPPVNVAQAMSAAPTLFGKVGLTIG